MIQKFHITFTLFSNNKAGFISGGKKKWPSRNYTVLKIFIQSRRLKQYADVSRLDSKKRVFEQLIKFRYLFKDTGDGKVLDER